VNDGYNSNMEALPEIEAEASRGKESGTIAGGLVIQSRLGRAVERGIAFGLQRTFERLSRLDALVVLDRFG
jgi:hypothetical protein